MKAVLINGSPRAKGCTFTALTELKNTLEQEGIEAEIVHVGNKDIRGCIACRKCRQTGKCVFDDVVNEIAPKLKECDAFVIGSPVYFASPAGGAISFLDRLFFSTFNVDKSMKVGAAVVTCRRGGNTATFDVLNKYFAMNGMPSPPANIGTWSTAAAPRKSSRIKRGCRPCVPWAGTWRFWSRALRWAKKSWVCPKKNPSPLPISISPA